MHLALALGEEPDRAQPSKTKVKRKHDMTIYPIKFHRRLEQKWASRIDQILTLAANATPPRDPNDNDDDEDEDEDDEERDDEPAVVREPEPEE